MIAPIDSPNVTASSKSLAMLRMVTQVVAMSMSVSKANAVTPIVSAPVMHEASSTSSWGAMAPLG